MPSSSAVLPDSASGIPSAIDGVTYVPLSTTQTGRILSTTYYTLPTACAFTPNPTDIREGVFLTKFNLQIPAGATITGIEVVSTQSNHSSGQNSYYGSFGSFSNNGYTTGSFRTYLYNGTEFSDALTFDPNRVTTPWPARYSMSFDNTKWSISHHGQYYQNDLAQCVFHGSPSSSHGLSWDGANSASWGVAVTFTSDFTRAIAQGIENSSIPIAGITRGYSLRAHYTVGYNRSVAGAQVNPDSVIGISSGLIDNISGVSA